MFWNHKSGMCSNTIFTVDTLQNSAVKTVFVVNHLLVTWTKFAIINGAASFTFFIDLLSVEGLNVLGIWAQLIGRRWN